MSCECYQIGGRFIAEDPECYEHGREAQERERETRERNRDRDQRVEHWRIVYAHGTPDRAVTGLPRDA